MAKRKPRSNTYYLSITAAMTAALCVMGPIAVPIGPVPISLLTFGLYLAAYLLGKRLATLSCAAYLLIGLAGMPVFTGFVGGFAKLFGPTGGYILGYLPLVLIAGSFIERFAHRGLQFAGMALGTLACYALGTAWFCISMDSSLVVALGICVLPFIPGDIAKMAVALKLGPSLKKRLRIE